MGPLRCGLGAEAGWLVGGSCTVDRPEIYLIGPTGKAASGNRVVTRSFHQALSGTMQLKVGRGVPAEPFPE